MNDQPHLKDYMMAVVTVSAVLLALTPVFLAIQSPTIAIYVVLALSFILGLVTIGFAVDWLEKPTTWRKQWAKWCLIFQTLTFTSGSFILLGLPLFSN
jgi:predicted ABC-type exoprotein transport system permease subunit